MAIFTPCKKTGDVMGREVRQRPGKKQRRKSAIEKNDQELSKLAANPASLVVKAESNKFREQVLLNRKRLGLV